MGSSYGIDNENNQTTNLLSELNVDELIEQKELVPTTFSISSFNNESFGSIKENSKNEECKDLNFCKKFFLLIFSDRKKIIASFSTYSIC